MHLTPQQQQLVNLLADGSWHCTVAEEFMKDELKMSGVLYTDRRYKLGVYLMVYSSRAKEVNNVD